MKVVALVIVSLVVIGIIGIIVFRSNDDTATVADSNVADNQVTKDTYQNISPATLSSQLSAEEDIFLLDVHIPEQTHIDGTDLFIPYNELADNISQLPNDKNQKIVVYCRSGSMSRIASEKLLDLGYTNVSNLEGGINAWNSYNK